MTESPRFVTGSIMRHVVVMTLTGALGLMAMFLVDLAVPRDMEAEIATLPDAYLYTVDDLDGIIAENMHSRRVAALQADEIVQTQMRRFIDWLHAADAAKTVARLRNRGDRIRAAVLDNARRQLLNGVDPDQVLSIATNKLVNKLLHAPSVRLREAGAEGRSEILAAADELFDLDSQG